RSLLRNMRWSSDNVSALGSEGTGLKPVSTEDLSCIGPVSC
ncbi:hypothetical protein AVEN_1367-1, partial [Araneus ventricosus]